MFRSSENVGRMVCEGCSYVAEVRRTVVEACSIAFDKWCLLGTHELRFGHESSETRHFHGAEEVTNSQSISGIISHSRATLTTHNRESQLGV